jgi:type IV fimbrial biogenesis protein FimT
MNRKRRAAVIPGSNPLSAKHLACGFTLVELLVVIVIVSILMAIGVPSYRSVTNSNRITAEANGLLGDLQLARAEAIKQGQTVVVCASTTGAQCSNSNNWRTGWILFADTNASGTVDGAETIVRVQRAFSGTDTFVATNAVSAVTFNREGIAVGVAAGTVIKLHDATNNTRFTRCVSIAMAGMSDVKTYGGTCT